MKVITGSGAGQTLGQSSPAKFETRVTFSLQNLTKHPMETSAPQAPTESDQRHTATMHVPPNAPSGLIWRIRAVVFLGIGLTGIVAATHAGVVPTQDSKPEQAPLFRARTQIVELDVTVLGKEGRPVRGLSPADFAVLEDGVRQSVVAFVPIEVPMWAPGEPAWTRTVAPDVVTNRSDARRAIVIIFDDFAIPPDPGISRTAKAIATRTIDELGPADLAAVVYTFDRRKGQEFTSDRARLRAAIDRFVPSGIAQQQQSRFTASAPTRGLPTPSVVSPPSGACPGVSCLMSALRNTARILGAWRGVRKTAVVITPGQPLGRAGDLDQLPDDFREALAAVQQANVTVHEFDPRGITTERQPTNLGLLVENLTGGRVITNTNEPSELVPQIVREASSYYLIGYQPTNVRPDGRFRRVDVRVNRPGLRALARAGYYAPSDRVSEAPAQSPIDQLLSSGLPTGDLPLTVAVSPFSMPDGRGAALAVVAGMRAAELPAGARVDFVATAFDDSWKEVARIAEQFLVPDRPDPAAMVEVGTLMRVRPGRYETRVAIASSATALAGSVYASVTVPDFARSRLSLSGIVIERRPGGAVLAQALAPLLPARPTTARVFSPDDAVSAIVRVCQGERRAVQPVEIAARILDGEDRVVLDATAKLVTSDFNKRHEADYRLDIPLSQFRDGQYLLTIEAIAKDLRVSRDVRFSRLPKK